MYTVLWIAVVAVMVSGIVGTAVIWGRQPKGTTLDRNAHPATVKHPILANPIFMFYVAIPIVTVAIAMLWLFFTS